MLKAQNIKPSMTKEERFSKARKKENEVKEDERKAGDSKREIFDGLVIYINESTYPLMSDHKLKHLLTENGAKISIHLRRKQVTHVILGRSNGCQSSNANGAGGSLAASKIQKEIKRVGGCEVKHINVDW